MKCVLALTLAAVMLQGREPSLKDVLKRAGDYVARYHHTMTSVIAEERYVQRWATQHDGGSSTSERTLVSDFILLSGGRGEPPWVSFRDVLEVDGVPVRERDNRLQNLFSSSPDAVDRATRLSVESTRYNIGPSGFVRTINTPIVAIDFLLPEFRSRFAFHRERAREADRAAPWEVRYTERERPTVIRTPEGRSVPARGSFRLDPIDGRILSSTLDVMDGNAVITVSYAIEPKLNVSVPTSMAERYRLGRDVVEGDATYTKYRRFETGVRIVPK